MRTLPVFLGSRSYEIHIGEGLLDDLGRWLHASISKPSSIALISDESVASHYESRALQSLSRVALKHWKVPLHSHRVVSGEACKHVDSFARLQTSLIEDGLDRHAVLIALGGGALSDLVGFVASTFMRGVPFCIVPTTLLSMVDASVGGKTAINLPAGKNLVGTFHQPSMVLADTSTLGTLPDREIRSGLAEVLKYGIIQDPSLFGDLEKGVEFIQWEDLVYRSLAIKANIVSLDERESGLREHLNLGHTFGHGIENATQFTRYTHGEAVGLGMLAACHLGETCLNLDPQVGARLRALLSRHGLPTQTDISSESILEGMVSDKKKRDGKLRFVVPTALGSVTILENAPDSQVHRALASIA